MTDTDLGDYAAPPALPAAEPVKLGLRDVIRSFSGFDEKAIERFFGKAVEDLSGTTMGRAAFFILQRRSGVEDGEAYKASMLATIGEVDDTFASDEGDGDSPEA